MIQLSMEESIKFLKQVKQSVQRDIIGQEAVVDGLIAALFTGGHVLLESNPGLGKTSLAVSFAKSLGMKDGEGYGRIQFTPDLLPSDITGTMMPDMDGGVKPFVFRHGPIFRQILLADEINRATPKTQAAMLEAMAEKKVTVLGETHALIGEKTFSSNFQSSKYETPFMVIGTQNPIDQEGTYELPEAQLDRFQLKLLMEPTDSDTLVKIVERVTGGDQGRSAERLRLDIDAFSAEQCGWYVDQTKQILFAAGAPNRMLQHAANLVQATNGHAYFDQLVDVSPRNRELLAAFVEHYLEWPLGPRAAISLILATKTKAFLLAADDASPDMKEALVEALVAMAPGVLRHRLKFKYDWLRRAETDFAALHDFSQFEQARNRLILHFLALTAPEGGNYNRYFEQYVLTK